MRRPCCSTRTRACGRWWLTCCRSTGTGVSRSCGVRPAPLGRRPAARVPRRARRARDRVRRGARLASARVGLGRRGGRDPPRRPGSSPGRRPGGDRRGERPARAGGAACGAVARIPGARRPGDRGFRRRRREPSRHAPFTTARMPFGEQGAAALGILAGLMDGAPAPSSLSLPTHLVVRQSCGCPSAAVALAGTAAGPVSGGCRAGELARALRRYAPRASPRCRPSRSRPRGCGRLASSPSTRSSPMQRHRAGGVHRHPRGRAATSPSGPASRWCRGRTPSPSFGGEHPGVARRPTTIRPPRACSRAARILVSEGSPGTDVPAVAGRPARRLPPRPRHRTGHGLRCLASRGCPERPPAPARSRQLLPLHLRRPGRRRSPARARPHRARTGRASRRRARLARPAGSSRRTCCHARAGTTWQSCRCGSGPVDGIRGDRARAPGRCGLRHAARHAVHGPERGVAPSRGARGAYRRREGGPDQDTAARERQPRAAHTARSHPPAHPADSGSGSRSGEVPGAGELDEALRVTGRTPSTRCASSAISWTSPGRRSTSSTWTSRWSIPEPVLAEAFQGFVDAPERRGRRAAPGRSRGGSRCPNASRPSGPTGCVCGRYC